MSNVQNIVNSFRDKLSQYESASQKTASDKSVSDSDLINALRKQADEAGNTATAKDPLKHKPENEGDNISKSPETGASKDIKAESKAKDENVSTKKAEDRSPKNNGQQSGMLDSGLISAVLKVAGISEDFSKTASENDVEDAYTSIYKAAYHIASNVFRGGR